MAGRFRFFEWLWLSAEASRAREESLASLGARELIRRAELAVEIAERVQRPPERFENGRGDAVACELYRQAIHWSLAARDSLRAVSSAPAAPPATGEPESLDRARSELVGKSFHDFAELEAKQQKESAARLESLAKEVLKPLRTLRYRLERLWIQRVLRVGALLFLLLVVVMAVRSALRWNEIQKDLADSAPWTLSSRYAVGGCESPAQACAEGVNYFFHTNEEDQPWVMFDLGRDKQISSVWVENRRDCCAERAMPLVVEVSSDQRKWKQVARHETVFNTWDADFSRVRARFVRLRVPQKSILHLGTVRILP